MFHNEMIRRGFRRLALAALLLCPSAARADIYTVPLLVPSATAGEPQGMVRILNATDGAGTVAIHASDDAGMRSGPATFTLNASAAVTIGALDDSGTAATGGEVPIQLDSGGYFEEGGHRYTCQSAGGCEIVNRQVRSGTMPTGRTSPVWTPIVTGG